MAEGGRSSGFPGQQLGNQLGQLRRQVGIQFLNRRRLLRGDGDHGFHGVAALPRQLAGAELVENAAQAEQVGPAVDLVAPGLLRRHVGGRADDHAQLRQPFVPLGRLGQAEIEDFHPAAGGGVQPDVGRLDVAVDQPVLVRRRQPPGDFPAQFQDLVHRQRSGFALLLLEVILQRHALEQLHGQERHAAVLADLVDGDDVVVLDLGGGAGLAQEAFAGDLALGHLRQHGLEGDGALQLRVLGQEDHPHAALAQQLQDAVGTEPADLVRGPWAG